MGAEFGRISITVLPIFLLYRQSLFLADALFFLFFSPIGTPCIFIGIYSCPTANSSTPLSSISAQPARSVSFVFSDF